MRILVLLNAKAGTIAQAVASSGSTPVDHATLIRNRFATHSIEADVRDVPGDQLAAVTRSARDSGDYRLIIAGGGDGTLNTVASQLIGSAVVFGVLPLGTFNHLAKELGGPLDLEPAIDALARGRDVPFNVGEVNGQPFLLFAAIGLYTDMIRHRDAQRKALGRRKMWAGTLALIKMLFRWPLMRVRFLDPQPAGAHPTVSRLTSVVYVSLSGLQMTSLGLADPPTRPREALSLIVLRHIRRRELIWQALRAVFHRLSRGRDLELSRVDAITLAPRGRRSVRVGYDGEVATMRTPLRVNLIREGLRLRMPATDGN